MLLPETMPEGRMGKQESLTMAVKCHELWEHRTYHPGGDPPKDASALRHDRCSTDLSAARGCQEPIPKAAWGGSTIDRPFRLARMPAELVEGCERWVRWTGKQSRRSDKAVLGGPDWAQPDGSGKAGTKRSLLVDGEGGLRLWLREPTCTMPSFGGDPGRHCGGTTTAH